MSGENHYSTSSRKKILEILKKSKDKTITAAQIGDQLKAMESEVNITTVYRYLDRLEKDGEKLPYLLKYYKTTGLYEEYKAKGDHFSGYFDEQNLVPTAWEKLVRKNCKSQECEEEA